MKVPDVNYRKRAASVATIDLMLTCMELTLLVLLPIKTVKLQKAIKIIDSDKVLMFGAITFLAFFLLFKLWMSVRLLQATCFWTEANDAVGLIGDWDRVKNFFFLFELFPLLILLEWIPWLGVLGIVIFIWMLRDVAFPKILGWFINELVSNLSDPIPVTNIKYPVIFYWSICFCYVLLVVAVLGFEYLFYNAIT